jgi:hypothetical protein
MSKCDYWAEKVEQTKHKIEKIHGRLSGLEFLGDAKRRQLEAEKDDLLQKLDRYEESHRDCLDREGR